MPCVCLAGLGWAAGVQEQGESERSFVRRDGLIAIQEWAQKKWAEERVFESDAADDGTPKYLYVFGSVLRAFRCVLAALSLFLFSFLSLLLAFLFLLSSSPASSLARSFLADLLHVPAPRSPIRT